MGDGVINDFINIFIFMEENIWHDPHLAGNIQLKMQSSVQVVKLS